MNLTFKVILSCLTDQSGLILVEPNGENFVVGKEKGQHYESTFYPLFNNLVIQDRNALQKTWQEFLADIFSPKTSKLLNRKIALEINN